MPRLVEVIHYVQARYNAQVVLIGGATRREAGVAQDIGKQARVQDLVGTTSMKQLAAVIEAADLLIAPDTGPVHIARAMGTPVIGLYAVAPSWLTGPYGKMEYCIDHFADAVRDILGQDSATVPWKTRVHDERAMQMIGVDEVKAMVDRVFADRAGAAS